MPHLALSGPINQDEIEECEWSEPDLNYDFVWHSDNVV